MTKHIFLTVILVSFAFTICTLRNKRCIFQGGVVTWTLVMIYQCDLKFRIPLKIYFYVYTNSLVNANLFYANFTNTTFQKIPIPHLTVNRYFETEIPSLTFTNFFLEPKVVYIGNINRYILIELSMEIRIAKFWEAIIESCVLNEEFRFS